jgi:hypothetical protein
LRRRSLLEQLGVDRRQLLVRRIGAFDFLASTRPLVLPL